MAVLILYDMLREAISPGGFAAIRKRIVRLIIMLIISSVFVFGFLNIPIAYALLYGDVNEDGSVNIQDVVLVMQHTWLKILLSPMVSRRVKSWLL